MDPAVPEMEWYRSRLYPHAVRAVQPPGPTDPFAGVSRGFRSQSAAFYPSAQWRSSVFRVQDPIGYSEPPKSTLPQ